MRPKISRIGSGSVENLYCIVCFLLFLAGCQPAVQSVKFSPSYQQHNVQCDNASLTKDGRWKIQTLRWFISDLEVQYSGSWYPTEFVLSPWQTRQVALLSLVAQECNNVVQFNNTLRFTSDIDLAGATSVRFNLGLPFELNHLDPLQQPSPLNIPDMFWSWQMGYKFLRLDMQHVEQGWSFHLGSIGCQADSRIRAPKKPCSQPNLFQVEVEKGTADNIELALEQLLRGVDPDSAQSCMFHGHASQSCDRLLYNLQNERVFVWR